MDLRRQILDEQLYTAAGSGNRAQVQRCLQDGASPAAEHGRHHRTPLHAAAEGGHVEVVQLLLDDQRVFVDTQDFNGCTPLHLACANGRFQVFQLLIDHGAQPNIKDSKGSASLHTASYSGSVEMVQQLLQLPHVRELVNAPAGMGNTPLHLACRQGDSQVAQLLVAASADATAKTEGGATPMYEAVSGKHVEVVEVLLAAGVSAGAPIKGSQTGLHVAAHHGYSTILQQLLAAMPAGNSSSSGCGGVDKTSKDMTALHMAVEKRHPRSCSRRHGGQHCRCHPAAPRYEAWVHTSGAPAGHCRPHVPQVAGPDAPATGAGLGQGRGSAGAGSSRGV
jgi:ankyrin repeat protein